MGGEIEIVLRARFELRIENTNAEVVQALRGVREITDEGREETDVGGVNLRCRQPCLNRGFDHAEAAGTRVEQGLAQAHDLAGHVAAGAARNDPRKIGSVWIMTEGPTPRVFAQRWLGCRGIDFRFLFASGHTPMLALDCAQRVSRPAWQWAFFLFCSKCNTPW